MPRVSITSLKNDLMKGFSERYDDPERLKLYSEQLWLECEAARKTFKMGRVRAYDEVGLLVDERQLELVNTIFEQLPELGIF